MTFKLLKIRVCIKARTFEEITIPYTDNICKIHHYLNDKYGLDQWLGYEITAVISAVKK
jgi:hypothetical protein